VVENRVGPKLKVLEFEKVLGFLASSVCWQYFNEVST